MAAPASSSSVAFDLAADAMEDFVRMPGLLRRWEIQQVVTPTSDYRIEPAGETGDGTPVFAVYYRAHDRAGAAAEGLPVTVCFDPGRAPVPGKLVPLHVGEALMGVLVVSPDPKDDSVLARLREHVSRDPQRAPTAPGPAGARQGAKEGRT